MQRHNLFFIVTMSSLTPGPLTPGPLTQGPLTRGPHSQTLVPATASSLLGTAQDSESENESENTSDSSTTSHSQPEAESKPELEPELEPEPEPEPEPDASTHRRKKRGSRRQNIMADKEEQPQAPQFVTTTIAIEDLTCPICYKLLTEPVMLACYHRCCVTCAYMITKCPMCKKDVDGVPHFEARDKFLEGIVKLSCSFPLTCSSGTSLPFKDFQRHEHGCKACLRTKLDEASNTIRLMRKRIYTEYAHENGLSTDSDDGGVGFHF